MKAWLRITLLGLLLPGCCFVQAGALTRRTERSGQPQSAIPAEARDHFLAAKKAEAGADWESAEREYSAAIKLAPRWAEAMVDLGIVLNREGRFDQAIRSFESALVVDPKLYGAQLDLGIAYFRRQQYEQAEAALRAALAIQPGDPQASKLLLLSMFGQDKFKESAELGKKLAVEPGRDAAVLEVTGRACLHLHDYSSAAKFLDARAKLAPESAEVHLMLGEALDNLNDEDSAIAEMRRAIDLAGPAGLKDAHFLLGYVLWKLRRYDEAASEFKKQLAAESGHPPSTYYLGNIALDEGKIAEALPLLETAAKQIPNDFAVRYDFGKALLQSGSIKQAIAELRMAITINPKKAEAHFQLGQALKRTGQQAQAEQEFETVRQLNELERADLERKVQGEENKNKPPF
ncbi:MAG TPA: tetratricopeptide repeat protein [Blastocatellia bacterium]|nr:tetratricopeptide repeat protein [Blastocatellia bacterium]